MNKIKIENLNDWKELLYNIMTSKSVDTYQEEQILLYKDQFKPKTLFKYRECNQNSFNNLEENCLFASNPSEFNDPFDSLYHLSDEIPINEIQSDEDKKKFINEYLTFYSDFYSYYMDDIHFLNFVNGKNFRKILLKSLEGNMHNPLVKYYAQFSYPEFLNKNFLILCFSEVNDSILMWTHYADEHKGFCIEYDISNFDEEELCEAWYPVFYRENLYDSTESIKELIEDEIINNPFQFIFPSLVKHSDWAYEKEWRYIELGQVYEGYDKELDKHKKIKMGKIKAIYLGMNIGMNNQQFLINFAKSNNIKIYKMYHSPNEISLKYKEIY